jgi:pyridoxal phosphate enzyme (YggS family)
MSVADNLARIRQTIGASPVKLVAVSKSATPAQIEEAFNAGVTEFGESRIQDALKKMSSLPPSVATNSRWHFIGHLQTNKVRQAVGKFALIHSVDSLHLAEEISRVAAKLGITQSILLQVKIVDDNSKGGFTPETLRQSFDQLRRLPNIRIEGLMTITPLTDDVSVWKRCFTGLKELKDELTKTYDLKLSELSMGMSADWQEAIACGATMVRLGRAIFDG